MNQPQSPSARQQTQARGIRMAHSSLKRNLKHNPRHGPKPIAGGPQRAPAMRRARLHHKHRRPERTSSQPEVLAEAGMRNARGSAPLPAATLATAAQPSDPPASGGAVTVDDFMRAAGARSNPDAGSTQSSALDGGLPTRAYATGVSHPDEDVSLTQLPETGLPSVPERAAAPTAEATRPALSGRNPSPGASAAPHHAEPAQSAGQAVLQPLLPPIDTPVLYRRGRLVATPPLRGSREILQHQNLVANAEGLNRIADDSELRQMRSEHLLVDFPESAALRLNPELEDDRRCARPWTVMFAANIARAYYARFHQPLQVNSAVRTVAYQLRLRRVNGNAAGTEGDLASPHLTGEAMDFGKHGMNRAEVAWMRLYLRPLMEQGKLDVEEEFHQACFHISVYRTYAPNLPLTQRREGSEFARTDQPGTADSRAQAAGAEQ